MAKCSGGRKKVVKKKLKTFIRIISTTDSMFFRWMLVLVLLLSILQVQILASERPNVLFLISDDLNNSTFKNQLAELKKDIDGMTERKMIVYKITTDKYSLGLEEKSSWTSSKIYSDTKRSKASFETSRKSRSASASLTVFPNQHGDGSEKKS